MIVLVVPSASDAEAVIPTASPEEASSASVFAPVFVSLIAETSNSSTSVTAMVYDAVEVLVSALVAVTTMSWLVAVS